MPSKQQSEITRFGLPSQAVVTQRGCSAWWEGRLWADPCHSSADLAWGCDLRSTSLQPGNRNPSPQGKAGSEEGSTGALSSHLPGPLWCLSNVPAWGQLATAEHWDKSQVQVWPTESGWGSEMRYMKSNYIITGLRAVFTNPTLPTSAPVTRWRYRHQVFSEQRPWGRKAGPKDSCGGSGLWRHRTRGLGQSVGGAWEKHSSSCFRMSLWLKLFMQKSVFFYDISLLNA